MLIGVSAGAVYGFAAPTRHSEPTALAFQLPRERLTATLHQRVKYPKEGEPSEEEPEGADETEAAQGAEGAEGAQGAEGAAEPEGAKGAGKAEQTSGESRSNQQLTKAP